MIGEASLEPAGWATKELRITAEEHTAGWVRISCSEPFAADVTLLVKTAPDSEEILSRIDMPGQTPTPTVVTPVKVRTSLAAGTFK
ncbi:MAG TPA: hypothetical protein P5300_13325 [Acidobacteriota bacterium]|nr:hypothetical protein [Acidobacteriota bacterium]